MLRSVTGWLLKICCTEGPLSLGEMASHTGDPHVLVLMVCHTDSPHTPGKTVSHTGGPIFTSHIHGGDPEKYWDPRFTGFPFSLYQTRHKVSTTKTLKVYVIYLR